MKRDYATPLSRLLLMLAIILSGGWALALDYGIEAELSEQAKKARQQLQDRLALPAARAAAATRLQGAQQAAPARAPAALAPRAPTLAPGPGGTPDYFGMGNWANSPLPTVDPVSGAVSGGIRKFVDSLPGLGAANANNLGKYIPVAVPDTASYPGSDYYEIELRQYTERMHSDLPLTTLRGYVQVKNGADVAPIHYLGPIIVAQNDRPVRIKFTNKLPNGAAGDLFIPVDTTVMGAGMGPKNADGTPCDPSMPNSMCASYTQNRATLHLHGGTSPWISDGTPHQWITPAGEATAYPKGVSVSNVPDMPDPGDGSQTFFYSNQQSARLMFYHDHAYGITRLNVYAGEAAGYLITDTSEQGLVASGAIPADQIPLIIQDKTFVPDPAQLAAQDPTWDPAKWGGKGNLWFPHVYMPNQTPNSPTLFSGINPYGRWDYAPWIYPPLNASNGLKHGPITLPDGTEIPGTPNVSMVMEAFMDTPVVNGAAYPFQQVGQKVYRLRILNACNDRFLNLGLYYAKSTANMWNPDGTLNDADAGEVPMVAAAPGNWPAGWPAADSRVSGFPDPASRGPAMIQIGTEGGFLPAPVIIPNRPVGFDYDRRSATFGSVKEHGLFLGPAERADVIVDFSQVPAGSKIILYNDAPAPVPAFDPRLDYYTGNPDQTAVGGAPSTLPGYGPNTRTIMQFQVTGDAGITAGPPDSYNASAYAALATALPPAFAASQHTIIVPQAAYGPAYGTTFPDTYSRVQDAGMTITPVGSATPLSFPFKKKTIFEFFEMDYGRMNATLGTEIPFTSLTLPTAIPLGYIDPPTEKITASPVGAPSAGDGTQLWRITHNGVDTHAIHFHLFDVQVVNRLDIAGAVYPPDANELGWKETVRMNPVQEIIVALRPVAPQLPFGVPESVRPLDPTMPIGSTVGFSRTDPVTGLQLATPTTNQMTNFGWEYVWHCHLLGHEEMDMMRPMVLQVQTPLPTAPVLSVVDAQGELTLNWTDPTPVNYVDPSSFGNPANEIGFRIESCAGLGCSNFTLHTSMLANQTSFVAASSAGPSRYRVVAYNAAGSATSNVVDLNMPLVTAPTELNGTAKLAFNRRVSVNLNWQDNSPSETGIRVQRATNANFTSGLISYNFAGANRTAVSLARQPRGRTLYYRVAATSGAEISDWSNVIAITTP